MTRFGGNRSALPVRLRLAIVCGALVGLLIVVVGAFVYLRLEADLRTAVDDKLQSRAAALLSGPLQGSILEVGPSDVGDVFSQVLRSDGSVVAATPDFPTDPLLTPSEARGLVGALSFERTFADPDGSTTARLLAVRAPNDGVLVVGVSFDDQRDTLGSLLLELAIALPLATGLAAGVGWLVAGAALRPVERLRREAEALSGSEPERRLAVPATGDELAALGRSLNGMLDRLQETVERERRMVDDASHELRTPLANLKAELDLALGRPRTAAALTAAVRSAADETDRLVRLAEALLVLARTSHGRLPLKRTEVDVAGLVRDTVASFTPRATEERLDLLVDVSQPLGGRVDAVRLRQAIGNLVDNAIRHAPRGGSVTVSAGRRGGALWIQVADTGGGFPAAFLSEAFRAFTRADTGRARSAGGAGLGLAIVEAIVEAHGGTVVAANRPEGGATVELRIPD
ncbi:MAG TPA: ATP-binding protein [Candidatus Limnocylindrales bacterium]|nr:ATP-binding protein [Candidatus Limnocylindrales bacterium]